MEEKKLMNTIRLTELDPEVQAIVRKNKNSKENSGPNLKEPSYYECPECECLESLIKKTCKENWNYEIENAKNKMQKALNSIYRRRLAKELVKLAEQIKQGNF